MRFEMLNGEQPVAAGDSREIFGVDSFYIGQRLASGIREYKVVAIGSAVEGAVRIGVEPL